VKQEIAYFGGGCFWCLEAVFLRIIGVLSVISGYTGGKEKNPTYERVCTGATGHAETVKIVFNPKAIGYEDLLKVFFLVHNPITPNQQGNDVGEQYRSVIFYTDDSQKKIAEKIIKELEKQNIYDNPIVTQVVPLKEFYPAESYHQKYFEKNPQNAYCQAIINPKLAKLRKKYKKLYKD